MNKRSMMPKTKNRFTDRNSYCFWDSEILASILGLMHNVDLSVVANS